MLFWLPLSQKQVLNIRLTFTSMITNSRRRKCRYVVFVQIDFYNRKNDNVIYHTLLLSVFLIELQSDVIKERFVAQFLLRFSLWYSSIPALIEVFVYCYSFLFFPTFMARLPPLVDSPPHLLLDYP